MSAPAVVLAALDALERELAVAADRKQKVVEVVGDPAGEVTDRLEPVRVPKLLLELLAALRQGELLGDVADHRQGAGVRSVLVEQGGCADERVHLGAVAPPQLHLVLLADAGSTTLERGRRVTDPFLVAAVVEGQPPLHLLGGRREHARHRIVDERRAVLGVDQPDAFHRRLDDAAIPFLGVAPAQLGLALVRGGGDVGERSDPACRAAAAVRDRLRRHERDPGGRARALDLEEPAGRFSGYVLVRQLRDRAGALRRAGDRVPVPPDRLFGRDTRDLASSADWCTGTRRRRRCGRSRSGLPR